MNKTFAALALVNFAVAALTGGLVQLVCGVSFLAMSVFFGGGSDEDE